MYKTLELTLDTERTNNTKTNAQNFLVNTNDYESIKIIADIVQDKERVDLSDATVKLAIRKPDKTIVFQDGTVTAAVEGECEFVLETQSYVLRGTHVAEVMIYFADGKIVVTRAFAYHVAEGILTDTAIESTSWYQDVNELQLAVQELQVEVDAFIDTAVAETRAEITEVDQRLTSQLADTAIQNVKTKGVDLSGYGKKSKVLVSFVSDDGQDTDYTILKPIFEAENVPCCMAITTGFTGKPYFDKPIPDSHGLELQAMGWEICGHTHNHPALAADGLTEAQIEEQFKTNNDILRQRGYKVNNLMYPHGSSNELVRRVARKYYRSAWNYGNGRVDVPPFDTYNISRVGLGAYFDAFVDNATKYPAGTRNTFETYYKKRVDEAVEKGGWLVFGLHSNAPEFDATQQEYLRQTIQYVKSLGIPIVTINDGLDLIGNIVDVVGTNSTETDKRFFRIGSNGKISTSEIKDLDAIDVVLANNAVTLDSPLSAFEMGKISYCFTSNGMLITNYKYDDFAWQTFKKKDGTNQIRSIVYPAMTWTAWETIITSKDTKVVTDNVNTVNSVLGDFLNGKVTHTYVKSATGTPSNSFGLLVTDRTASSDDTVYQTFKPTNKGDVYTRYWVFASSAWSAWQQTTVIGQKKNWYRTNVTVPADGTLDVVVASFTVANTDIVVGSPYLGLPNGISYYIYVGSETTNNVHIKFVNSTASPVALNVEWLLRVM